ncbi:MAG: hypothetical protein RJA57_1156, partial [Bacteroidota bacterium]
MRPPSLSPILRLLSACLLCSYLFSVQAAARTVQQDTLIASL